jgi:hypothetical protein
MTLHSESLAASSGAVIGDPLVITGVNDEDTDTTNFGALVTAINAAGGGHIIIRGTLLIKETQAFTTGNVRIEGERGAVIVPTFDGGDPVLGDRESVFQFKPASNPNGISIGTTATQISMDTDELTVDSGHGVVAGDWIRITSDKQDERGDGGAPEWGVFGQAVKIRRDWPATPTLLLMDTPLFEDVQLTSAATFFKMSPLRHIRIENLTYENRQNKVVGLLELYNVQDVQVENVVARREVANGYGSSGGMSVVHGFDVEINGHVNEGVTDRVVFSSDYHSNRAYGIIVSGVGHVRIIDCTLRKTRHGFTTGSGLTGNPILHVEGCTFSGGASSVVDTHDPGRVVMRNCAIESINPTTVDSAQDNNARGLQIRCPNFVADSNTWNCLGAAIVAEAEGAQILNNNFNTGGEAACVQFNNDNGYVYGNTFIRTGRMAVHCGSRTNIEIAHNRMEDGVNEGSALPRPHIYAVAADDIRVYENLMRNNANVDGSLECGGATPTTTFRFHGNKCLGYGSGDDGVVGTRATYVNDLATANLTDA